MLLVTLGDDLPVASVPDPLFAPPAGTDWHARWSSADPACGGDGCRTVETHRPFVLAANSALVFAPGPRHPPMQTADLEGWQSAIA